MLVSEAVPPVDKRRTVSLAISSEACLELLAGTRALTAQGTRNGLCNLDRVLIQLSLNRLL